MQIAFAKNSPWNAAVSLSSKFHVRSYDEIMNFRRYSLSSRRNPRGSRLGKTSPESRSGKIHNVSRINCQVCDDYTAANYSFYYSRRNHLELRSFALPMHSREGKEREIKLAYFRATENFGDGIER